jgi:molybdopterin converting factor small subunit
VAVVRYFAGARAAAGTSEERLVAATLGELIAVVGARGERIASVLAGSSFLVDGLSCHDRAAPLPGDCTVDVLPPFAGG